MRRMPTKDTLPCYILYDEFGHSTLPSFVSVANTIRGYKVSLSIVLQSMAQLSARYGHDYAKSIQGGFNTYLTYSGADPETAGFFEEIAGRVIETRLNKIEDMSQQRQEFNLLNADAVRRIGNNQAVIVSANKNPGLIETRGYFEDRRLKKIPGLFGPAFIPKIQTSEQIKRVPLT